MSLGSTPSSRVPRIAAARTTSKSLVSVAAGKRLRISTSMTRPAGRITSFNLLVRTRARSTGTAVPCSTRVRTNPAKIRNLPTHLDGKNFPASASKDGVATKTWDLSTQVVTNLSALGIEHLIAIGGDDTLSYAAKLHQLGVKIIAIPKTMDNDVRNTEYCIGFSTAITRASDAIQRQRTTVGSHERIGVFRVFGRDTGFTALYTAYATSIRCVIPEYKVNLEKLIQLLLDDKRTNPSNYALVVLSEGATWDGYAVHERGEPDAYGHRKKASVAEVLAERDQKANWRGDDHLRSHL